MCKCPEVGTCLRSSKEAVGNSMNKTQRGAKKKVVLGLTYNSEYPNFPSALSEMSTKLLWTFLSDTSRYHNPPFSVTTWFSSHSLGGVRLVSFPSQLF